MTTDNIGERLFTLRKAKGLSQAELATFAGVSREMIGRYERGTDRLSLEVAANIARGLGISLDYLVGDLPYSKLDKETLKLVSDIDSLSEGVRERLFYVVRAVIRDAKS